MIDLIYPEGPVPQLRVGKGSKLAERLPIVDAMGNVKYQSTRHHCHSGSHLLHPVVHLHILNRDSKLYLQYRSAKCSFLPHKWDTAVGGHVTYGEYILEALYREASEELGFYNFNPHFLTSYEFSSERENELVNVFAAIGDFNLTPDKNEVEVGRWWSMEEISENIGKGIFTPNFESEFIKIKDQLLALL